MTNAQDKSASDHSLIEEGKEVSKSSNDPKTNGNNSPDPELLNKLPPEARKVVEVGMMSMQRFGPMSNPIAEKLRVNRNWCGKTTLFLPFFSCFTSGYAKIKKCHFFTLNTIVKILIS